MNCLMKTWASLAFACLAAGAFAGAPEIRIVDPWVQAGPPKAKVLAAYSRIENGGDKPQTVIGVSSPGFERIEIHRTVMHGNMAHMEQLKELTIPPRTTMTLKPGGLHFMLMNARQPLQAGDRVPMTLTLKGGGTLAFEATVRSARMADTGAAGHGDHSAHGSGGR